MIYMFNESDYPVWDVIEKNDKFFNVGLIPKNADDKNPLGIDIVKNGLTIDNFFVDVLDKEVAESKPKTLWSLGDIQFNLCYNSRTGLPFLKPAFNTLRPHNDLYLIAYKLPEDAELIYEKPNRFTVLYTEEDKERGMVYIIAVAKEDTKPFYYLTYKKTDGTIITKHIVTMKGSNMAAVFIKQYTPEEAAASRFSYTIFGKEGATHSNTIRIAKVVVPYAVVVYPFENEAVRKSICEDRYSMNEKYTHYVDSNTKGLKNALRKLINMGYVAASFYIDKPFAEVTEEDVKDHSEMLMFKRYNFICSDGKIRSL